MPLLILTAIFQISLAVHCVRSGRDSRWIGLILFVPFIGGMIYLITQVVPDLGSNRTVRKAASTLQRSLDPQRTLRQRKLELERSDNFDNRVQLARECLEVGYHSEAELLFSSSLKGMHESEPSAMLGLAQAQFGQEKYSAARTTLEELIKLNPEFQSQDGHLLYARVLKALDPSLALTEYEALAKYFSGEEARARYASLLAESGKSAEALAVIDDMTDRARLAPAHYRRAQAQWLDKAARLRKQLTS